MILTTRLRVAKTAPLSRAVEAVEKVPEGFCRRPEIAIEIYVKKAV